MSEDHHNYKIWPIEHPHKYERGHSGCCKSTIGLSDGTTCGYEESEHPRWPCSPACTHDDAWTPGHPEMVRDLPGGSEGFSATANDGHPDALPEGPLEVVYPEGVVDPAFIAGFEQGAEAMRAACLGAVREALASIGAWDRETERIVKAAIEGATP